MRWIDAHHQRAISETRELQAGSGSETGLAYAPFAAEEKDAHASIIADLTPSAAGLPPVIHGTPGARTSFRGYMTISDQPSDGFFDRFQRTVMRFILQQRA